MKKLCTCCLSSDTRPFLKFPQTPIFNNVYYDTASAAKKAPKRTVNLYGCNACGFVFNASFDEKLGRYRGVYDNTQSHSPYFLDYMQKLAHYLLNKYHLSNKYVVEVGCGKGDFLEILRRLGVRRLQGFDPAYTPRSKQLDRVVERKYFNKNNVRRKADFIICRHTLEHIPRPREFVQSILECVAEDGVLYFEVPDLSWTMRSKAFFDFTYEHCNYFTPRSLSTLFEQFGYGKILYKKGLNGQYIQAEIRKGATRRTTERSVPFKKIKRWVQTETEKWSRAIQRFGGFVIWGAGGKGVLFANRLRISRHQSPHIIDVNINKQGKYTAGTAQYIVSPEMLRRKSVDTVIVMNPVYAKEIRARAKDLGFKGQFIIA